MMIGKIINHITTAGLHAGSVCTKALFKSPRHRKKKKEEKLYQRQTAHCLLGPLEVFTSLLWNLFVQK
jgi:hypothetical protein